MRHKTPKSAKISSKLHVKCENRKNDFLCTGQTPPFFSASFCSSGPINVYRIYSKKLTWKIFKKFMQWQQPQSIILTNLEKKLSSAFFAIAPQVTQPPKIQLPAPEIHYLDSDPDFPVQSKFCLSLLACLCQSTLQACLSISPSITFTNLQSNGKSDHCKQTHVIKSHDQLTYNSRATKKRVESNL